MKKVVLALFAIAALAASCKKHKDEVYGIFKGPAVQVHDGKAWTWVQLHQDGTPKRIAISINDDALNSLPVGGHPGGGHGGMENSFVLLFHQKAEGTLFKHIYLNWNPEGHEPPGTYDLPHFDLHYYMTPSAEREAIPVYEADSLKFKNLPAPEYLPQNYFPLPAGVPLMGAHWIDLTSPEFNGEKFGQTWINGSYDGKITFWEPMITLEFIMNNPLFERPIPQPSKFQKSGHYPTKFRMHKHDGVTDFILEEFVYKQQS